MRPASRKRHRTFPVGRAALGAISPAPTVLRELFADTLEGTPRAPARNGRLQAGVDEAFGGGEVGDFDIHLPRPQLARHLRQWRNHALGEVAVPLGPGGVVAVGEAERVDHVAALPAVVRRRLALGSGSEPG
jgi:hypothetical protein